jgi:hypothetical protein
VHRESEALQVSRQCERHDVLSINHLQVNARLHQEGKQYTLHLPRNGVHLTLPRTSLLECTLSHVSHSHGRPCLHCTQQWLSPAACLNLRATHAVCPARDPPAPPWRLLEVRHSTQQRSACRNRQCRYVVRAYTARKVWDSRCVETKSAVQAARCSKAYMATGASRRATCARSGATVQACRLLQLVRAWPLLYGSAIPVQ